MRYERKYRIEGLSAAQIAQVLVQHPAGFSTLHPDRQVNNIYFDTPQLEMYRENVMGIAIRNKYRLRWYGETLQTLHQPQLEIKHRHNELGSKQTWQLADSALDRLADLTKEVHRLARREGLLQPVLLNSYARSYWGSADGVFRITIDSQLRYHPILLQPHFRRYFIEEPQTCILELKYEQEVPDKAVDAISDFLPFRRTRNSKYVNGILLCYSM